MTITKYLGLYILLKIVTYVTCISIINSVGRTSTVGSQSDFRPRGHRFDARQGASSVVALNKSHFHSSILYMYYMFLVSRNKKVHIANVDFSYMYATLNKD